MLQVNFHTFCIYSSESTFTPQSTTHLLRSKSGKHLANVDFLRYAMEAETPPNDQCKDKTELYSSEENVSVQNTQFLQLDNCCDF